MKVVLTLGPDELDYMQDDVTELAATKVAGYIKGDLYGHIYDEAKKMVDASLRQVFEKALDEVLEGKCLRTVISQKEQEWFREKVDIASGEPSQKGISRIEWIVRDTTRNYLDHAIKRTTLQALNESPTKDSP